MQLKTIFKENCLLMILIALALLTRFSLLAYPGEVVFDEVYFGSFTNSYFTNQYYFDIHPPLGKLLIAGFAKIMGLKAGFSFEKIGEQFNQIYLAILRFLPALFGSLIPIVAYFILRRIGISKKYAFLGGFLLVFDNALLTQSKFILLDSLLLCFGFSAIYFFLKYKDRKDIRYLLASVSLATLAFGIKWTGLSFIALIFLIHLTDYVKDFLKKKVNYQDFWLKFSIFLFLPLVIYYSIFWIHFKILYKSGTGDAYMSTEFQKTLEGSSVVTESSSISDWQKFVELNQKMYYYNSTLKGTHPNSSHWFQWVTGKKLIWYWTKTQNNQQANIYLTSNPIIWWAVLAGVITSLFSVFIKDLRKKLPKEFWFFVLGYFANLLPYILIQRVAFLYHYLPSLVFGVLILAILYERVISPYVISITSRSYDTKVYYGFLTLCFLSFLLISPLSYGIFLPLKVQEFYRALMNFFS